MRLVAWIPNSPNSEPFSEACGISKGLITATQTAADG
jgi:hypothetical protein